MKKQTRKNKKLRQKRQVKIEKRQQQKREEFKAILFRRFVKKKEKTKFFPCGENCDKIEQCILAIYEAKQFEKDLLFRRFKKTT